MDIKEKLFSRGSYNLGGRINNAARILAGLPEKDAEEQDLIERMVNLQKLETGSPKFLQDLAQTKANIATEEALNIERLKAEATQKRAQAAMDAYNAGQGDATEPVPAGVLSPVDLPTASSTPVPSSVTGPLKQLPSSGGAVPQYLRMLEEPARPKYNPQTGMVEVEPAKYKSVQNLDYVTPEQRAKQEEADRIRTAQDELLTNKAKTMLGNIREAKMGATRPGTKFFGKFGGEKPTGPFTTPNTFLGKDGDDRIKWEQNINQLLANQVLEVMNEMRAASKSGSTGFGALSEKELETLRQAASALNRRLAPDDALSLLRDMERIYLKVLRKPLKAFYEEGRRLKEGSSGGKDNELSAIDAELAQIDAALGA